MSKAYKKGSGADPFQVALQPDATAMIFAMPIETPDIGTKVVTTLSLDTIYPDPTQPRRIFPPQYRKIFDGKPTSIPNILSSWITNTLGDLPLVDIITGKKTIDDLVVEDKIETYHDLLKLISLAASIYTTGLLQPIAVAPLGNSYKIIFGERRYTAHQLLYMLRDQLELTGALKQGKIQATIEPAPDVWKTALENVREDLNAIGKARVLAMLLMEMHKDEFDFKAFPDCESDQDYYAQVADGYKFRIKNNLSQQLLSATGFKSRAHVNLYRNLLAIPAELWQEADAENWTEGKIRQMLQTPKMSTIVDIPANTKTQKPVIPDTPFATIAEPARYARVGDWVRFNDDLDTFMIVRQVAGAGIYVSSTSEANRINWEFWDNGTYEITDPPTTITQPTILSNVNEGDWVRFIGSEKYMRVMQIVVSGIYVAESADVPEHNWKLWNHETYEPATPPPTRLKPFSATPPTLTKHEDLSPPPVVTIPEAVYTDNQFVSWKGKTYRISKAYHKPPFGYLYDIHSIINPKDAIYVNESELSPDPNSPEISEEGYYLLNATSVQKIRVTPENRLTLIKNYNFFETMPANATRGIDLDGNEWHRNGDKWERVSKDEEAVSTPERATIFINNLPRLKALLELLLMQNPDAQPIADLLSMTDQYASEQRQSELHAELHITYNKVLDLINALTSQFDTLLDVIHKTAQPDDEGA
jgi:hypothetical protein